LTEIPVNSNKSRGRSTRLTKYGTVSSPTAIDIVEGARTVVKETYRGLKNIGEGERIKLEKECRTRLLASMKAVGGRRYYWRTPLGTFFETLRNHTEETNQTVIIMIRPWDLDRAYRITMSNEEAERIFTEAMKIPEIVASTIRVQRDKAPEREAKPDWDDLITHRDG